MPTPRAWPNAVDHLQLPGAVIARVQGDCYGGGVGLVAACDMAVAADTVHFCLSEVKLGLIPPPSAPM